MSPSAAASPPDYPSRLQALRERLKQQKLNGFLVPMADEYQNEIIPACAQRIAFLSGFTGSAGLIALLGEKNAFFTDGRYTLQASQQLPKGLFEIFDTARMKPAQWLQNNARSRQNIGFDPCLHTASAIERYQKAIEKTGAGLVPVAQNPIDSLWKDRPAPPCAPIHAYDVLYAGRTSAEKRAQIAKTLTQARIQAAILTDPASIAWLLNVRGNDVPFSPLPLSMAILRADGTVEWFVDPKKMTQGLNTFLGPDVLRYDQDAFFTALKRLGEMKSRVRLSPEETPYWIEQALKTAGAEVDRGEDPCALARACKNATELDGMRTAHRRDGAALTKLLAWLDQNVGKNTVDETVVTELEVERKLNEFRAANHLFKGPSFATIAGAGENGAIVHYRATEATNQPIKPVSLFLLDSGGQYADGTTDVTRTVAIGQPIPEMRDRFTRVLKGHIALASIVFPEGTTGAELDVLARQFLWTVGLDYNHGTGHGVGNYLNVHEGPQSISKRGFAPLLPGMVVSNEPGFYKAGHYGIRIENLQAVIERLDLGTSERKMFAFEPLTLAPIDRRLIATELLWPGEKKWIDDYHDRVRHAIRPLVDEATAAWLEAATAPL